MSLWLADLLKSDGEKLLRDWVDEQVRTLRGGLIAEKQLMTDAKTFLAACELSLAQDPEGSGEGVGWQGVRSVLEDLSRARGLSGFSPSETANFVFTLKKPLFDRVQAELKNDSATALIETQRISTLLDRLGLFTTEVYQKSREVVISRQQNDLLELSTPVVKLWNGIIALPMVGTLDSVRSQTVMETLLTRIVETEATIAIIDITGVPTVDTLTAQHLLKTVAAARLMGTDCIISGIRPQIAQTIVHLAIDLGEVVTKSTLADAFMLALSRTGHVVRRVSPTAPGAAAEPVRTTLPV